MSDRNPELTQALLDWDRIAADIQRDVEAVMDHAHDTNDVNLYRGAGLIRGKIAGARRVMLDSRVVPSGAAPEPREPGT